MPFYRFEGLKTHRFNPHLSTAEGPVIENLDALPWVTKVYQRDSQKIPVLDSMTPHERLKPDLIKASRKRRIAAGAGVPVQEVNRLLNQFEQTQKVMKMMAKGGLSKMMRGMKGMFPGR